MTTISNYVIAEFQVLDVLDSGIIIDKEILSDFDEPAYYPRKAIVLEDGSGFLKNDILILERMAYRRTKDNGTLTGKNTGGIHLTEVVMFCRDGVWSSYGNYVICNKIEAEKVESAIFVEQDKFIPDQAKVLYGNDTYKEGSEIVTMRGGVLPLEDYFNQVFKRNMFKVHLKQIMMCDEDMCNGNVLIKPDEGSEQITKEGILATTRMTSDETMQRGTVLKSGYNEVHKGDRVCFLVQSKTNYKGNAIVGDNSILYKE